MSRWFGVFKQQGLVLNACAVCAILLLLSFALLIGYVFTQGSHYFWPAKILQIEYTDADGLSQTGYLQRSNTRHDQESLWLSISRAEFPYQTQLNILQSSIKRIEQVQGVAEIRLKRGRSILAQPVFIQTPDNPQAKLETLQDTINTVDTLTNNIRMIKQKQLLPVHEMLGAATVSSIDVKKKQRLESEFTRWQDILLELEQRSETYRLALKIESERLIYIPLADIASLHFPNDMRLIEKLFYTSEMLWQFLSDYPKQSNTAGGVFPALFGTLVMVLLMALIVSPFGVLAAVYMNEYAPSNTLVSVMRLCVSNMAAVPSIVYGVFGLGFLVYEVGGNIDALFFKDALPAPTMGAPGVFWASLTMALLTLPVVIVATDEGLNRVPVGLRKGSYALGATKSETIFYTVIPHASPSIMTGIILAIARAAGEVAPLMLLGAVRFAPNLPIDNEFPFIHLDRQFMHLGVLVYDGAFTSQINAKGASMMFATCSLLILLVVILNIVAMTLRAKLRKQYQ